MNHNVLYAASIYFFLASTSALSIIDGSIYGEWPGKPGDKITQTLNLLSILTSVFCFCGALANSDRSGSIGFWALSSWEPALISVLWSVDPGVTYTQGLAYFSLVLGAIGLAEALNGNTSAYNCLAIGVARFCLYDILRELGI